MYIIVFHQKPLFCMLRVVFNIPLYIQQFSISTHKREAQHKNYAFFRARRAVQKAKVRMYWLHVNPFCVCVAATATLGLER
jgi:hypothetical protein